MSSSFQIEQQAEREWCWAAVGVSINRYFSPTSTLRQCELATAVIIPSLTDHTFADCCQTPLPEQLDLPEFLEDALTFLGTLAEPPLDHALSFKEASDQILAAMPVCVRIGWFPGNRGHYVVIRDCPVTASGEQWVDVADPFFGYSTMRYEHFVSAYKRNGRWTGTFLVKEP